MATTWGKPSPSIVARAAFLRSRKNAACSSALSWICWRRLMAICGLLLSSIRDQQDLSVGGRGLARSRTLAARPSGTSPSRPWGEYQSSFEEPREARNRSGAHSLHPAPFAGRTGVRVGARIVGPDHVALAIAPVVLVRHRHLHRLVRPIWVREGLDTSQVLPHGEVPAVLTGIAIVGDLLPVLLRPVAILPRSFSERRRVLQVLLHDTAHAERAAVGRGDLVRYLGSHVAYPLHWSARANAAVNAMV